MDAVLEGSKGVMHLVVSIAGTAQERAQGLMGVEHMPLNRGMLFVFDTPDAHAFWMYNTPIPLDIVPLGDDGTILETLPGVPQDTTPLVPATPVLRVLEINAGLIETMGAGDGKGRFVLTGGTTCDADPPGQDTESGDLSHTQASPTYQTPTPKTQGTPTPTP
jgi:uncharacterized membrane protein (UPF0127 family)